MAITLGRDIASLRVRRQLSRSSDRVSTVFERLSSGLRINKASDDPAGLAVAAGLNLDAVIANKARENVNEGISLLQVADGALSAVQSVLERQRELAQQAANGSLSREQRQALSEEYQALDQEITRIASVTEYNGINLLTGNESNNAVQSYLGSDLPTVDYGAFDISGNGRYILYTNATTQELETLDLETGETTLIASSATTTASMSGSGDRVVFWSNLDLAGENAGGFQQLYLWDRNSGEYSQLTQTTNAELPSLLTNYRVAISADGNTVAFSSLTRYNQDGSEASYSAGGLTATTIDLETGEYNDLGLNTLSNFDFFELSADGSYLAFTSSQDITGGNPDTTPEIFLYDNRSSAGSFTQITNESGLINIGGIQVTDQGDVYLTSTNDLTGQNAGGFSQLFRYRNDGSGLSQLTNTTTGFFTAIGVAADGSSLTVLSTSNLDGSGNTAGLVQAFRYDTATGTYTQLTNRTSNDLESFARASADGSRIVQITGVGSILQTVDIGRSETSIQIQAGTGNENIIEASIDSIDEALRGVGGFILTSQDSARGALESLESSMESLGISRAKIGASLSRFDIASRVLYNERQEKLAAKARIEDADIASETAALIREQILQQVGAALLSQNRLNSDIVLQLLSNDS